ncbi:hypothetical protein OPV22_005888 [Ensete ventricosum]|uniref:Uncharacterized protein n=1 Tax=Ensete ventricosum TaxID=4639 RepID=A0AAV8Q2N8_ENSVE|nr:hypothetical protein OPV22_005888 [Ensete ventricosum]
MQCRRLLARSELDTPNTFFLPCQRQSPTRADDKSQLHLHDCCSIQHFLRCNSLLQSNTFDRREEVELCSFLCGLSGPRLKENKKHYI